MTDLKSAEACLLNNLFWFECGMGQQPSLAQGSAGSLGKNKHARPIPRRLSFMIFNVRCD